VVPPPNPLRGSATNWQAAVGKTTLARLVMNALFGDQGWHKINVDIEFNKDLFTLVDFSQMVDGKTSQQLYKVNPKLLLPGLIADEINRSHAKIVTSLMHLFDREINLPNGEKVKITDDAVNSPQNVSLSGTGILPVTVTPTSLTFTVRKVGTTSASQKITIKNNLPPALTISSFAVIGPDSRDFIRSATTCGTTLAAGASCIVSVAFAPTAVGSRTAVLSIVDSAITSPQAVALTGTGK